MTVWFYVTFNSGCVSNKHVILLSFLFFSNITSISSDLYLYKVEGTSFRFRFPYFWKSWMLKVIKCSPLLILGKIPEISRVLIVHPSAWDVNHPFVQRLLPISRLGVALLIIRSVVSVSQCLWSSNPYFI